MRRFALAQLPRPEELDARIEHRLEHMQQDAEAFFSSGAKAKGNVERRIGAAVHKADELLGKAQGPYLRMLRAAFTGHPHR